MLSAILLMASCCAVAVVAGFFGAFGPYLDALAQLRLHLAALMVLLALPLIAVRSQRLAGLLVVAIAAMATFLTVGVPWPSGDMRAGIGQLAAALADARFSLLQLNLRFDNPRPDKVLSLVARLEPDIVTLDEVSDRWIPELDRLAARYPYRVVCKKTYGEIGGVAVLSRRPFVDGAPRCLDRGSLAMTTVDFGGRQVDVAALHLGWPIFDRQDRQVSRDAGALAGLGTNAILAGDLNAVPWSETARRVARYGGLVEAGSIGPTWLDRRLPDWLRPWIGLPIDHVLVKGGVLPLSLQRMASVGSDHLPVLMNFIVLPTEKEPAVMRAELELPGLAAEF